MGRGSAYYLRERPDAFHVFIYAPFDEKVRRLRQRGKTEEEAIQLAGTVDHDRAACIKEYFGIDWPSRYFFHLLVHGGDKCVLILMKRRPPLFFLLQIDKVFRIEEARRISSVIWAADLTRGLNNLREAGKKYSHLVRDTNALAGAGAGCQSATDPKRSFVQVREKLRTDDSAKHEIRSDA